MSKKSLTKYESTTQPGLFFWAEPLRNGRWDSIDSDSFVVISQAKDGPASEAYDDWLANEHDASETARKLAKGEL